MELQNQLVEAWANNQQMNIRLLNATPDQDLDIRGPLGRTRNVRNNWIHMHHTRLNWMGAMLDNPPEIERLRSRSKPNTASIVASLEESSQGIAMMLQALATRQDLRPFKGSVIAFLAMMVAHEAHHRAHILLLMRNAGKAIPRAIRESLWDFAEDLDE